jgi:hypothetical protein
VPKIQEARKSNNNEQTKLLIRNLHELIEGGLAADIWGGNIIHTHVVDTS